MHILICGSSGFLGNALFNYFHSLNNHVSVLGRNYNKIKKMFPQAKQHYDWESLSAKILQEFDVVINLSGANIGSHRWTKRYKNTLIKSRTQTTHYLSILCDQLEKRAPHLINASAVGIYGMKADIHKQEYTDTSFLKDLATQWENAIQSKSSVTIARLGPVLSRNGGFLKPLSLMFRCGLGAILGSGNQPINWVLLDDVCRAFHWIIENKLKGPINIVAPHACTQKQFAQRLAKTLHRFVILRIPAWLIKILWKDLGKELFLYGQNAYPDIFNTIRLYVYSV